MTFSTFLAYLGVTLSILVVLGFWKLCELVARFKRWFFRRQGWYL